MCAFRLRHIILEDGTICYHEIILFSYNIAFCCRFTLLNINIATQTTFCLVIAMLIQRIPYDQIKKIMTSFITMVQLPN